MRLVQFRDLGPLLVDDGVARPPGGARLSTVLAVLLSRVGEPVGTATLAEAVWGAEPPARAGKVLESHVWRLRKVLEPDRGPRALPTVLQTDPLGYRLVVAPDRLDSHRLATAADAARASLAAGRHDDVVAVSAEALALWRGSFCSDVADTGWLAPVRERFSELRLALVEQRAAALVALGQPERAAHELAAAVAEHPLREPLWELRILALYRAGRQAAALTAYDTVRRMLADELGVDPGPALAALHQRILVQDDALTPAPAAPAPTVPVRLPSRRASILGREADLDRVAARLAPQALVTLLGPGGVGKTRLATEVAFAVRDRFPAGVWFVDLGAVAAPASVPVAVADVLAPTPVAGTTPEELVLGRLADRQALLVMDNCEHVLGAVADFVGRLLDRCPSAAVLATSREPLELPGEQRVPLGPLATDAAVRLFLDRSADARPDDDRVDPTGPDRPLLRRICAAVGGLPLGIELAAARTRTFELAEIADSLDRAPGRLSRSGPGPDRHATLLETVDWSYRLAGPDEQILHRRLAVLTGVFTVDAAAALCAVEPLHPDQALDVLGGLVHRSLVTARRTPGRATSFAQLVPIRAHADHTLTPTERDAVVAARDRWVLDHVLAGPLPGAAGQRAFYDWLDDNLAAVRTVLRSLLVERPAPAGIELAARLVFHWHDRERLVELVRWAELVGDASRVVGVTDVARAVQGCAAALGHDADAATAFFSDAVPALAAAPPPRRADAARLLFVVSVCAWTGDLVEWATTAASAAVTLADQAGDPHTAQGGRAVLAASALLGGDGDRAVALADAVLADPTGNQLAILFAEVTHSITAQFGGDGETGLRHGDAVLRSQLRLGTRNFADSFESRGAHLLNAGQLDEAARFYALSSALSAGQGRGWPWHPGTDERLTTLRAALGPAEFGKHWDSGLRMAGLDPTELVAGLVGDLGEPAREALRAP
ncbi:MAG: hypothetical protein ABS80_02065 [Pseudonocardia sp. SCN 72-51]|nr:MAG: hypothetical protein ABS80_02065 [Pseudonocardia sp. SCN 72-51]